jgi:glycerate kinase
MNIIVCPDSFKGSLSAVDACEAITQGVRQVLPQAEIVRLPLADGGEGTVEALVSATGGRYLECEVQGPLGAPVAARFGVLGDDTTAVVEMAAASGLTLVPPDERNPLVTTTYGTGELIAAALEAGCTRVLVGIGGSATNDGGAGMAQALGVRLRDEQGEELPPGGAALARLAAIDISGLHPKARQAQFLVACDVTNPLVGAQGASAVYGPQKGATPEMVAELDASLAHYAQVIAAQLHVEVADIPGAGAAGGLGAGLMAFLGATMRMGIALVLEAVNFGQYLEAADLVITGEGKLDSQTAFGKTLFGVGRMGQQYQVPVVALVGMLAADPADLPGMGIQAAFSILPGPRSEEQAVRHAGEYLQMATEQVMRLVLVGRNVGEGKISRR